MPSAEEKGSQGKDAHEGRIPGYAECHFCTVRQKRRALRCVFCIGRHSLRERIVRAAEDRFRRRVASLFSLIVPGSGHIYRSSPGTGLFFMFVIGSSVAYLTLIKGEMTSGRWFLLGALSLIYLVQAYDAGRGPGESTPPCQTACPAGLSCALYVGLTRESKMREALEMVELKCPFPGTVGRVCHHPCEQSCRRAEEGEAIAICALKRFLADYDEGDADRFYSGEQPKSDLFEEKIAVIGGGPSGLSAALYLRIMGFAVTVFEAREQLGGMPAQVIPEYRLPGFIIKEEVERILSTGIEIRTGRALGGDFSLEDIKAEGFAAVYLALGAQRTVRLPHCGTEEEGFIDGLEFLRAAKAGTAAKLDGNVIVIGGGNVAVDVAKTALRLGGESVRKIFLETRETMPAHTWECEEAVEEGVELSPACATVSFEKDNGKVSSALCRRVERIEFDEKGRIRPVLSDGTDFTLKADWVITAVGTGPDYGIFPERPHLKPLRPGLRVGLLPKKLSPGIPVMIGGDYFGGPASVIEAIAAGYEGALEIYRRLGKFKLFRAPSWRRIRKIKYPNYQDSPVKMSRRHVAKVEPDVRCDSFCEVCESYDSETAREEADRCLRCCWPMYPVKLPRRPPPAPEPAPEEKVGGEEEPKVKEFF